ncbi:MAG: DivIVA domain-containing protein [Gammaproteobacteria bacterium]|nr:DivIVA domain-containing protein [Gammaproteobacteria bacterium]
MAGSLRPEDVTAKSFKSGWRGYDTGAVDAFLREVFATLTSLQSENEQLRDRLHKLGDRDLHAEFDQVSAEVGELLQSARETAEGMRFRASVDAEEILGEARDDAVRVRQDAWNEGTALLEDSQEEADALIDRAKRDSLAIISDAERDAYRIASKARKDADETIRRAKLQADQLIVDARSRCEELTREGESEMAAARERVTVLMQRRDELLVEIRSVQAKIDELRAELEERRAEIGKARAADTSTVKVLPGPIGGGDAETSRTSEVRRGDTETSRTPEVWHEGEETVRIVRPPKRLKTPTEEIDAEAMAAEVRKLRQPPKPKQPEPIAETAETVETAEAEPTPEVPEAPEAIEAKPVGDYTAGVSAGIDELFAKLRSESETAPKAGQASQEAPVRQEPEEHVAQPEQKASTVPAADPFEVRDRLLLPITNKTLRTLKRSLTEAQNIALDELRVQETVWKPDVDSLEVRVAGDLEELLRRAVSAGWSGAEQLLDREFEEGDVQIENSVGRDFATAIIDGVRDAVDGAGEGPRRRAAAISRVYRAWRVDAAERQVRSLAIGAYHDGLIGAFEQAGVWQVQWMVAGRGCVTCRTLAEAGPVDPGAVFASGMKRPPAHESCECTLVPV